MDILKRIKQLEAADKQDLLDLKEKDELRNLKRSLHGLPNN